MASAAGFGLAWRGQPGAGIRCPLPPRHARRRHPYHPPSPPSPPNSRVSPKARLRASPGLQQLGTNTRKGPAGLPKRSVASRVTRPPHAVMRSRSAGLQGRPRGAQEVGQLRAHVVAEPGLQGMQQGGPATGPVRARPTHLGTPALESAVKPAPPPTQTPTPPSHTTPHTPTHTVPKPTPTRPPRASHLSGLWSSVRGTAAHSGATKPS